jgi:hypothetical protein
MTKVSVQMIPIESPDKLALDEYYEAETDAGGNYSLTGVAPGKYFLGVNLTQSPDKTAPYKRTFYPGALDRRDAKIIEVGLGQKVSGLDLQLMRGVKPVNVSGSVTFPDGKPASDIGVTLEDVNRPSLCVNGCDIRTDSAGKFRLVGYAGYTYFVKAYDDSDEYDKFEQVTHSTPKTFTLKTDLRGVRVILIKKPK